MSISIQGTQVDTITYADVVLKTMNWVDRGESRYIFAANVHMIMEAYDSTAFREIVNSADLVTPDGMPLVWMLRLKGFKNQERVYGPTLMLHLLEAASREKIPVGFYGSTPGVLGSLDQKMKMRFPSLEVNYSYSPPFRDLTEEEDNVICSQIRASGVRILFVGLGCPKQEIWMADHRDKINAVMVGVGAAFDFHAGTKPQAPAWMQSVGLEWLFRLFHEPRRLARRYFYNNPRFIFLAMADLLGLLKHRDMQG